MEKNNNFFEWYKRKITENPQDPPADAWDNIADELDTNDVWDKVVARLDNPGGWFGQKTWHYALPALLLLLIPAGLYFYNNNTHKATPATTVSVYADTNRNADADNNTVADRNANADRNAVADNNANADDDAVADSNAVANHNDDIADMDNNAVANNNAGADHNAVADSNAIADHDAVAERSAVADDDGDTDNNVVAEGNAESDDKADAEVALIADGGSREVEPTTSPWTESAVAAEVQTAPDERSSRESDITTETDSSREGGEAESFRDEKEEDIAIQSDGYTSIALQRIMLPDSMLIVAPLALTIEPDLFDATIDLPSVSFSPSLEFGISGAVRNTWLLNQTTFAGLERHTLTTTLPDFGKNIGMAMRYNFARRFSVQAEAFLISEMGQRYNEYRKGKYIERDVDLNYFHGTLLFKYGNNAMMLDHLVNGHGIIGGLYFSKLKSASETIDDHTTDVSDAYSPSDYGIILGYEYNQRLFSNFFFTSGVRLNYGLKNIRPSSLSNTGTASFDVNLGVRYRF